MLNQIPSLFLETKFDNVELFIFISPALVCDILDDEVNIGLIILKQLNANMMFSETGPIIFNFESGPEHSVNKSINSKTFL